MYLACRKQTILKYFDNKLHMLFGKLNAQVDLTINGINIDIVRAAKCLGGINR